MEAKDDQLAVDALAEEIEQRLQDDPHDPEVLATLSPYLAARAHLSTAWEDLTSVVFRPVVQLLDLLTDML
jgi:cytochrome c-type biogenesis protein CcmH/NrfG